jgi:hypothetical protein
VSRLHLFVGRGWLSLRDAHAEDNSRVVQFQTKSKIAHREQLAQSTGDMQEYDKVGHVWPDRTRSTSPSTHAHES